MCETKHGQDVKADMDGAMGYNGRRLYKRAEFTRLWNRSGFEFSP